MTDSIRDGVGTGSRARVNENNRLHVHAVTTSEDSAAGKAGDSYNINTGIITLTDAVDTPILYLKNNESKSLHVEAIAVGMGPSTGGTGGIPKVTVVRNPTTIDFSADVDIKTNRNYGSEKTLDITAYKGNTGATMSGGDDHLLLFQTTNGRLFAEIDEIITPNKAIGVKIDPQASNTSMDVYVALICHLEDPASRNK